MKKIIGLIFLFCMLLTACGAIPPNFDSELSVVPVSGKHFTEDSNNVYLRVAFQDGEYDLSIPKSAIVYRDATDGIVFKVNVADNSLQASSDCVRSTDSEEVFKMQPYVDCMIDKDKISFELFR